MNTQDLLLKAGRNKDKIITRQSNTIKRHLLKALKKAVRKGETYSEVYTDKYAEYTWFDETVEEVTKSLSKDGLVVTYHPLTHFNDGAYLRISIN